MSGGTFGALRNYNFRVWSAGALVSNIGTWMQRIAQDWLVLTQLTHHNAAAVGLVTGLQFGPQVLLLPWTGLASDRFNRRRLLLATQAAMGVLALGLGALTLAGAVRVWHVYLFALASGCVSAFDTTARQTFVSDMVEEADLGNAIALNSTSFNASRMIGPAVAGAVIAAAGTGGVFLLNAATFAAVMVSLLLMRPRELVARTRRQLQKGALAEGFAYVWQRRDLRVVLAMVGVTGALGMNFAIFTSTMAASVFHIGAGGYGLLTACMAIGSVSGSLLSARPGGMTPRMLTLGTALFGVTTALAAIAPSPVVFGVLLALCGAALQTFTTASNGYVQMSTEPALRGRVMSILLAVALGGAPLGSPFVGWVANVAGPRWALAVGAASGIVAAAIGLRFWRRQPAAA